ncbi:hypothetical protein DQ244_07830 [Blastococcus sp. TBT05-19]|uniref:hypothetical protein n=1 Tax=Blastococcus sp. TBT05-19 TaxID=2250581 RepID=UPI000DEBACC0|nr:hypothetical protein [Blastococcus sp. TBT05-19]RBY92196.1 hypothetical protein DQ244_07830 [Blastococcus sp. TBT05-19]
MTSTDAAFTLRMPTWARVWLVVFPLLVVAALLSPLPLRGDPGVPVRVLFAGAVIALSARMWVMGAVGRADGRLVVRNQLTTRTYAREEVAGAGIGRERGGRVVVLELADGSTRSLDVTLRPLRLFDQGLQRELALVRRWLDTR